MRAAAVKEASTVILVRPTLEGFEALLTRRPREMEFLGGLYVFPGGTVSKEDCSEGMISRCHGRASPEDQRYAMAGIREIYEEVGILLCLREDGRSADMQQEIIRRRLEEQRRALLSKSLDFCSFLESEKLLCDVGRLRYFSRWLTPEEFPVRFDTRFYLALLPENQTPLRTSLEVAHSLWITPESSLQLCQKGELPMIFPTFASLRTLANFESLDDLFEEYPGLG